MSSIIISGAVEGVTDEVVLRSLITAIGAQPGPVYGKKGKDDLKKHLVSYNQAAKYQPWCILLDLDQDNVCAPGLRQELLPDPAEQMCFRIVIRSVEAWLMADRERLATFLAIGLSNIPTDVEALSNPKETMVNLARRSRKCAIKQDMEPRQGSGRSVGPRYAARIIEFVTDTTHGWRPLVAAQYADSLQRCLHCLHTMGQALPD